MDTDPYMSRYITILKRFTTKACTKEQLNKPMLDFGINSFNAIEIMVAIEEEFHVEFPDSLICPDLFFSPQTLYEGLKMIIDREDTV